MASQRVIRFSREDGGFVLIRVAPRGKKPLDVDLTGTENENPYFVSIYHDKLSELKSGSGNIEDNAWSTALSWALLRIPPPTAHRQLIERLEVTASIENHQKLVLKFRQDIEDGLKPRIGSIALALDENQELDLFEWAGMLANDSLVAEETTRQLSGQLSQQKTSLDSLQAQLDEFIKQKTQDEEHLLEKFRQLLNTKKLKIRDQQRLLAGAKVDLSAAEKVKGARESTSQTHGNSRSRPGKRKAQSSTKRDGPPEQDAEMKDEVATESEDDFEAMDSPARSESEENADNNSTWAKDLPIASGAAKAASPAEKSSQAEEIHDNEETDDEL